ncbi:MAG: hypothetical protein CMF59_06030 [Leptospiraceae bacterium]|nr:hypothetical protein [Leptospiraceae bacterium]
MAQGLPGTGTPGAVADFGMDPGLGQGAGICPAPEQAQQGPGRTSALTIMLIEGCNGLYHPLLL